MNKALVIVDVQNDFMPWGSLPVENADSVVPAINSIVHNYKHVVLTQDWHPAQHSSFASTWSESPFVQKQMSYGLQTLWPDHCIQGTAGADFVEGLITDPAFAVIRKGLDPQIDSYSAFFENDHVTPTGLQGLLERRNITELDFVGVALDYCVAWSAMDAAKLGFKSTVLTHASAAIDLDGSLDNSIGQMRELGVEII